MRAFATTVFRSAAYKITGSSSGGNGCIKFRTSGENTNTGCNLGRPVMCEPGKKSDQHVMVLHYMVIVTLLRSIGGLPNGGEDGTVRLCRQPGVTNVETCTTVYNSIEVTTLLILHIIRQEIANIVDQRIE